MKLSVVMPVYNEKETILEVIERVLRQELVYELIIVDDCSVDGTRELLKEARLDPRVRVLFHQKNRGKGAALRTGFKQIRGDLAVIQDADKEYNPEEYRFLIKPIIDGRADVVYGSRLAKGERYKSRIFFWLKWGNSFITWFANLLYGSKLTDLETCYKMFKKELLEGTVLKANSFDIEPELTAKFLKKGARIEEVPISYHGRSYSEGKKIFWWHGVEAIWVLAKYRLMD